MNGENGRIIDQFRDAVESPTVGFSHLDNQGHYVSMNRACAVLLGYKEKELLGKHWKVTVYHDDHRRVEEAALMARETGKGQVEFRGQCKDGRLVYQALTMTRISAAGAIGGYHCLRQDITNRTGDQEALALAVESAPNGLLMLNDKGEIQTANAAVEMLFGYSRQELLGRPIEILMPARVHQHHVGYREAFVKTESSGAMAGRDLVGLRKDGKEIPLQVYVNTIETPSGKLILATVLDIAERKRYQAQLELAKQAAESANRAKSDFLARMSHEIRTPMNLIMGMNALLLDSELNEKQRKHVEISYRNVRRLLRLINGILDLSKVEAGKLTLEHVPFDLHEALAESVATLTAAVEQKGLRLSLNIDAGLWRYRVGDPERLQQVLLNLLGNAIKFTATGSIHINARAERKRGLANGVRFEVSDTGCGIPKDKEELIFQAFQQAEGTLSRTYEGTGLGLSIAQTLVEMMGGQIWVEPKEGPGSKFVFTASLARATRDSVSKQANELREAMKIHKLKSGTRILLVEDNEENLILLQAYLEGQPVILDSASNGSEAVEKRKRNQYDLILMDMQMPIMDGRTATREVRKWEKESRAEPARIVALTAHALAGAEAHCIEAGCDAYLSKPVHRRKLLQAIGNYASNYASSYHAAKKDTAPANQAALTGIAALRPRYLDNRGKDLQAMRTALSGSDFDTIRRIAHDCKGTGTGYGFPGITALGRALEQAALQSDPVKVAEQLQEMERELASSATGGKG